MKMSSTSFKHNVWAFQWSHMIVKLQVMRRKNMDPKSGKDLEEIMCLLCRPSTLSVCRSLQKIVREIGKTPYIRLRFSSLFCRGFFLVTFWSKIIAECLEIIFLIIVHIFTTFLRACGKANPSYFKDFGYSYTQGNMYKMYMELISVNDLFG